MFRVPIAWGMKLFQSQVVLARMHYNLFRWSDAPTPAGSQHMHTLLND